MENVNLDPFQKSLSIIPEKNNEQSPSHLVHREIALSNLRTSCSDSNDESRIVDVFGDYKEKESWGKLNKTPSKTRSALNTPIASKDVFLSPPRWTPLKAKYSGTRGDILFSSVSSVQKSLSCIKCKTSSVQISIPRVTSLSCDDFSILSPSILADIDAFAIPSTQTQIVASKFTGPAVSSPERVLISSCPFTSVEFKWHEERIEEMSQHLAFRLYELESKPSLFIDFQRCFGETCSPSIAGILLLITYAKHFDKFIETLKSEMIALRDFDSLFDHGRPTTDKLFAYYESLCNAIKERVSLTASLQLQFTLFQSNSKAHPNSPATPEAKELPVNCTTLIPLAEVECFTVGVGLLQAHKANIDTIMKVIQNETISFQHFDNLLKRPGQVSTTDVEDYLSEIGVRLDERINASVHLKKELNRILFGLP